MIINGKPIKLPTESMEDFIAILCEFLYEMNLRIVDIEKKLNMPKIEYVLPDKIQDLVKKNTELFENYIKERLKKDDKQVNISIIKEKELRNFLKDENRKENEN